MNTRTTRLLFLLVILGCASLPLLADFPTPPEGYSGATLRTWLKDNWYTPHHITLGYSDARMYMYNYVDNHGDTITCVYGGYQKAWTHGGTGNNPDPINCEHTIPQSFFSEQEPMRSDLFHLYPTYSQWNSIRSNYPFSDITDASTLYWMINTTLSSTIPSSNIDSYSEATGSTFEPREDHKGNVARSVFYFFTMYPSYNMSQVGDLSLFLQWHAADPPDAAEVARNDSIQLYQGNRNPYIDHPDWVALAWGGGGSDAYPVISAVTSTPVVPTSAETLAVTATVTDDLGVSAVEIRYNIDGTPQTPVAMTATGTPNQYAGQIPACGDGDRVEFFVAATDTSDQTSFSTTRGLYWGTTDLAVIRAGVDETGTLANANYWTRIEASVTAESGIYSTTNTQIFVQDDTAGMCIFKQSSVVAAARHDRIRAVGVITQYNGLTELDIKPTGASFTNLGAGLAVEPLPITLAQMDETHEGLLVEVYGVAVDPGFSFPALNSNGFDIPITDYWHNAGWMDIDKDTNIDGMATPSAPFTLVGVVTQFDTSAPYDTKYKMLPRASGDVILYTVGDLNTDGESDLKDLVILLNHLGGNIPAGTAPFEALINAADIDESGAVNSQDLLVLAAYLAGN